LVEKSEVSCVREDHTKGCGVHEGIEQWHKTGGVESDEVVNGSSSGVDLGAEVTEPFLISGEGLARVRFVVGTNGGWVNEGSLANIDLSILKDTVFNPSSEELAAAKSFSPNNGQGGRGVESGGESEFIGSNSTANDEVGDVAFLGSGEVEDVNSLGDHGSTDW